MGLADKRTSLGVSCSLFHEMEFYRVITRHVVDVVHRSKYAKHMGVITHPWHSKYYFVDYNFGRSTQIRIVNEFVEKDKLKNIKKFILATLSGSVTMWLLAGLWHQLILAKFYAVETPSYT